MAKALTSGYVPIGAAIATKHVADAFAGPDGTAFDHRITFGGNPVSCAAGLANLDILQRELLVRNAADMGGYLFGRLQDLYRYDIVGQVRGGLGLICAVEIVADRTTREPFPKKAGLAPRPLPGPPARSHPVVVSQRLRAYALEPPLITQLPKDEAGSDTEASAFVKPRPDRRAGVTGAPSVTEVARQLTLCHGTVESTAVAGRPASALR